MNKAFHFLISCIAMALGACASGTNYPLKAIEPFDKSRYLGTWYEVARMDFRFERDLAQVTATYTTNPDGTIKVVNRGYHLKKKEWKQAEGKARFRGSSSVAMLEVSFFGPFYSDYNVIALDSDYQYALVTGKNTGYLWILSRTKTIPDSIKQQYLQQAQSLGFKTEELVWTVQN